MTTVTIEGYSFTRHPVAFDEVDLPHSTGVYIFEAIGTLLFPEKQLYVGRATRQTIAERVVPSHDKWKPAKARGMIAVLTLVCDPYAAIRIEADLIGKLNPPLNQVGRSDLSENGFRGLASALNPDSGFGLNGPPPRRQGIPGLFSGLGGSRRGASLLSDFEPDK